MIHNSVPITEKASITRKVKRILARNKIKLDNKYIVKYDEENKTLNVVLLSDNALHYEVDFIFFDINKEDEKKAVMFLSRFVEKEIINLTPHNVKLIDECCVEPAQGGGFKLKNSSNYSYIEYNSLGVARATSEQIDAGVIEDYFGHIKLFRIKYGEPEGLPDYKLGTYYIVSALTANAAKECYRNTDDLLIPNGLVRDDTGNIIGCTSFAVV